MARVSNPSVFRRLQSTYKENASLQEWIRADNSNPLNQISRIIDKGEVLDIGCGTGILGRLLAGKPNVYVDGIDPAINSENEGVKVYRRFFSYGIEKLCEENEIERYDWIVMADVIEHFAYPDEMLELLVAQAKQGARFLISTPNVAHLSVRVNLLGGHFDYVDSGILESTHLRFFTLDTLQKVLSVSGLHIHHTLLLNRIPPFSELFKYRWFQTLLILILIKRDKTLFAYQFLVVASSEKSDKAVGVESVGSNSLWAECLRYVKQLIPIFKHRLRVLK